MIIAFRPLAAEDYPLLLDWLQRPHVKEWWNDGDDTLEKVSHGYSADPDETKRFVLLFSEDDRPPRPAGYFQYWLADNGAVGVDQFLAEPALLGRGIGTRAVAAFVDLVIAEQAPLAITVDPHPRNGRAIRCYEKVGFLPTGQTANDEGEPAYMMRFVPARPR